ncbi:MAG: sigma-70 family RNA polymerase sigma factor [Flavobacteriales bacterium]|nr:sigma-70 family RNA polymerase sigma factor [Flavobacteriales bacterium]
MKDEKIINLIKAREDRKAIAALYDYYEPILAQAKKYGCPDEAKDIFQQCLLILIENARKSSFQLTSTIKTYITGIALNLIKTHIRSEMKKTQLKNELVHYSDTDTEEHYEEKESRFGKIDQVLEQIGDKCKQILKLYYLEKKSMKEIASLLKYSSVTSAKTQKYKCMERTKNMVQQLQTS